MGSICCKKCLHHDFNGFFAFSYGTFHNAHHESQIAICYFKLCISLKYFFLPGIRSVGQPFLVSAVFKNMFETMPKHSRSIIGYVYY